MHENYIGEKWWETKRENGQLLNILDKISAKQNQNTGLYCGVNTSCLEKSMYINIKQYIL
jgi:hypothetical protein